LDDKPETDVQATEAHETLGQSAEAQGALKPKGISVANPMKAIGPTVSRCVSVGTLFVLLCTLFVLFWQGVNLGRSVEVSRTAQRAWIGVVPPTIKMDLRVGSSCPATFTLRNFGKSPAFTVEALAKAIPGGKIPPFEPLVSKKGDIPPSRVTLYPDSQMNLKPATEEPMSKQLLTDIEAAASSEHLATVKEVYGDDWATPYESLYAEPEA